MRDSDSSMASDMEDTFTPSHDLFLCDRCRRPPLVQFSSPSDFSSPVQKIDSRQCGGVHPPPPYPAAAAAPGCT